MLGQPCNRICGRSWGCPLTPELVAMLHQTQTAVAFHQISPRWLAINPHLFRARLGAEHCTQRLAKMLCMHSKRASAIQRLGNHPLDTADSRSQRAIQAGLTGRCDATTQNEQSWTRNSSTPFNYYGIATELVPHSAKAAQGKQERQPLVHSTGADFCSGCCEHPTSTLNLDTLATPRGHDLISCSSVGCTDVCALPSLQDQNQRVAVSVLKAAFYFASVLTPQSLLRRLGCSNPFGGCGACSSAPRAEALRQAVCDQVCEGLHSDHRVHTWDAVRVHIILWT